MKHMTFNDRLKLEAYLKIGLSVNDIAAVLGFDRSTIYRELKRGSYVRLNSDLTTKESYSPDISQKRYRANLKSKGPSLKIGSDYSLAAYLEYKISSCHYSPAAALAEIKSQKLQFSTSISKTTLYRYIDNDLFLHLSNKDLPVKRSKHIHHKSVRSAARPAAGTSIENRPDDVALRSTFGHWEMDCVVGKKKTKPVLLVLTERLTRKEIIELMPDKSSGSVVAALNKIERKFGFRYFRSVFKSITVDNGCEFSDPDGMQKSISGQLRTRLYYCHPYSSWERGSNENQNKLVRRHYPKGFDFRKTSKKAVKCVEKWINDYPREIFCWRTSEDLFQEQLHLQGIC